VKKMASVIDIDSFSFDSKIQISIYQKNYKSHTNRFVNLSLFKFSSCEIIQRINDPFYELKRYRKKMDKLDRDVEEIYQKHIDAGHWWVEKRHVYSAVWPTNLRKIKE